MYNFNIFYYNYTTFVRLNMCCQPIAKWPRITKKHDDFESSNGMVNLNIFYNISYIQVAFMIHVPM